MKPLQAAVCVLVLGLGLGYAQGEAPPPSDGVDVGAEVPSNSTVELSDDEVRFDLAGAPQGYPPAEFPSYYNASSPAQPLEIDVFSNSAGGWTLDASLEQGGLVGSTNDTRVIPAEQLEYCLNCSDGENGWRAFGEQVALISQSGTGAFSYTLRLRLKIIGNELPDTYRGILRLTFSGQ